MIESQELFNNDMKGIVLTLGRVMGPYLITSNPKVMDNLIYLCMSYSAKYFRENVRTLLDIDQDSQGLLNKEDYRSFLETIVTLMDNYYVQTGLSLQRQQRM